MAGMQHTCCIYMLHVVYCTFSDWAYDSCTIICHMHIVDKAMECVKVIHTSQGIRL